MTGSMNHGAKAVLFVLAALALSAANSGGATLGVHSVEATNPCRKCHDTAKGTPVLRGWIGGSLPDISLTAWSGRSISSLCYMCHTSGGGGYTATNQSGNAYATASHSFTVSEVSEEPDGSPQGTLYQAVSGSTLPYAAKAQLECTSCHNVHRPLDRPFLNRATVAALCNECHEGRVNAAPVRGTANSFSGTARAFSNHPTGVAIAANGNDIAIKTLADPGSNPGVNVPYTSSGAYALGGHRVAAGGAASATAGNMDCGTCHAVHGVRYLSVAVNDLLAVNNTTPSGTATPSGLCEACHFGGSAGQQVGSAVVQSALPVGQWSDHPIDAAVNRSTFYPTGVSLPTSWLKANTSNKDSGAQYFYQGTTQSPVCSSCHDVHGGVAGTPLLRGPLPTTGWAGPFTFDEWCYACHPATQVLPAAHHSNKTNLAVALGDAMTSQLGCGDCHGPAGTTNWGAHNGFWAWPAGAVVADTDSLFCEKCHVSSNPATFVSPGLKGRTFAAPAFPATHGTVRGTASHYLGPDSGEFAGVTPKTDQWSVGTANKLYYSSYGAPNTSGGGTVAPAAPGSIICESCHNLLYNDGLKNPGRYTSAPKAGWRSNLLLEWYEDDPPGAGNGTGAYAAGSALCTGCHTSSGNHHALTGSLLTTGPRTGLALITGAGSYADKTGAPGTLSYPNVNALDCDSCHRPHRADSDSDVAGPAHGSGNSTGYDTTRPTRHILEVDGTGHAYSDLCVECHSR